MAGSSPEPDPAPDPGAPPDLDSFRAAEIDLGDGGLGVIEADAEGEFHEEGERIDQAAFWEVFQIAFAAPGMIAPEFKPVAIQPDETDTARAASDAIYRLLEIYYPAALQPGSETVALAVQAGPFIIGKVLVVRAILAARNARPVAQSETGAEAETGGGDPLSWLDQGKGAGQ